MRIHLYMRRDDVAKYQAYAYGRFQAWCKGPDRPDDADVHVDVSIDDVEFLGGKITICRRSLSADEAAGVDALFETRGGHIG